MINATMVVATIPVTDLERAKEFYGNTVGLTFLWETPVSVRFRCGPVSEISTFKRPPITTEHTLAHFEVDDIEAVVQDLNARGNVPPALAMAYVKTRCVLHGFAAARVERGEPIETHDLETRARAEIALRTPAAA